MWKSRHEPPPCRRGRSEALLLTAEAARDFALGCGVSPADRTFSRTLSHRAGADDDDDELLLLPSRWYGERADRGPVLRGGANAMCRALWGGSAPKKTTERRLRRSSAGRADLFLQASAARQTYFTGIS